MDVTETPQGVSEPGEMDVTETPQGASLVVTALLSYTDHRPADIWETITTTLAAGWAAVGAAEAAAILSEAVLLIQDPLAAGQPRGWQWNLGSSLTMLRRIAAGETIGLTEALDVIRVHLLAHRWHLDHLGTDRFADIRFRFLDCMARLVMTIDATDHETQLMARPMGDPPTTTIGALIRRRRIARGWNQVTLAERIGGDRSGVAHWETDRRRPSVTSAVALARELGGSPADYLHQDP